MIGMFGKVPLTTRIVLYVALTIGAVVFLYPFIYMVSVSLKQSGEIFGNMNLLPYAPQTIDVNGTAQQLYEQTVNGQTIQLVKVGTAQSKGVFIDPTDPTKEILVNISNADSDDSKAPFVLGSQKLPFYNVTLDDGTVRNLALLRKEKVGLYSPPDKVGQDSAVLTLLDSLVQRKMSLSLQPAKDNYVGVLQLQNMGRALLNTALVTFLVTVGQLFTSAVAGYAFARLNFPGRNVIFVAYLGTMMVPFVVIIIPLYQLMNAMGWINKLVSLIIPWFFTAYGTFFMRQFFLSIPKDLEEAALIDGATRIGILWRIFVPLSVTPLATLATFTFLYAWNSFLWPLISINGGNQDDQVVTLALNIIRGSAAQGPSIIMAAATLSVLPAMVVFILAQRYFIEGVSTTGLAGR